MIGWVKLHRSLLSHWIWKNDSYLKGWVYCMFRANHQENKVLISGNIVDLERGQFVTSIGNFAKDTGMSEQAVRTFWRLLESDEMISKQSTNKLTMITVCKYVDYQDEQQTNNKQTTNKQQTNNKRVTTDNNVNKEKELKEFKEYVYSFTEYSIQMLEKFISYWTEQNKSKTKFRFQMEKTWDTKRRLATWAERDRNYKKPESKNLYQNYTDSSFD